MEETKNMTLEQKVDMILSYLKKAERRAKIHTIISWVLIFVFFILPMIWSYYFFRNFVQSDQIMKGLETVKNLNDATSLSDFQNLMK